MNNVNYDVLLDSHLKFGTDKDKIKKYRGYEHILETVVIAPWWNHTMFSEFIIREEKINDKVYNLYGENFEFSFIELKRIGSPAIMDYVMSLGVTNCKKIIFLGSAGSLDEKIKIGDIVIPKCSVCGDGSSRYLNINLEDEFGKEEYPYGNLNDKVVDACNKLNINYILEKNFSIDSVFCQFNYVDYILQTGSKTIEMETAMLFKASQVLRIPTTAILCISDNIVANKSLYSGRTEEDEIKRHDVRNKIIPKIIIELISNSCITKNH